MEATAPSTNNTSASAVSSTPFRLFLHRLPGPLPTSKPSTSLYPPLPLHPSLKHLPFTPAAPTAAPARSAAASAPCQPTLWRFFRRQEPRTA